MSTAEQYFQASFENATILMNAREELSNGRSVDHGERRAFTMSALLWIVTAWETYVEERAVELATELADKATIFQDLPPLLQTSLCQFVQTSTNHLAAGWLSGDGWQDVVIEHAMRRAGVHDTDSSAYPGAQTFGHFNTPDASKIDNLFKTACGLENLSSQWSWQKRRPADAAADLKSLINVRGKIAHGDTPDGINRNWINTYSNLVSRLVEKTEIAANEHLLMHQTRHVE